MLKYAPLVWKNLGRNKLRSVLTGAAIAFAVAMACVLRMMPAGLDAMLNSMSTGTRISVHNEAGLTYAMPYAYLNKVRAMPGVDVVSYEWFGMVDADKGVSSRTSPSTPIVCRSSRTGIDPRRSTPRVRDGALVPEPAEEHGWKVGDLITPRGSSAVDAKLRGGRHQDRRTCGSLASTEQAMSRRRLMTPGMVWVRVADAVR
jgi:putative ABC transport system permease protein